MSFSWWCKDAKGLDLFKKHGVHDQALGLGPQYMGKATTAPFNLDEIRVTFYRHPYKENFPQAARDAIAEAQRMAAENLKSLAPRHCDTCTCGAEEPLGWSKKDIEALLSVPLAEVSSAGGGW